MPWPFGRRRSSSTPAPGDGEEYVVLIDERLDPRLVVYHSPDSRQAEQYRAFRTNLRAMNPGDEPRTLLFTSAQAAVGKSVSLANVALALTECETVSVCLVDADLRVSSQSMLFGTPREPGLSDMMLDQLAPGSVLRATAIPNLSLLTAGRHTDGPGEILTSAYMQELIGWLKRRFNYILFDSPPTLLFADAAELAAVIDGVILVVAIESTRRSDADRALTLLDRAGANVVGSFVTGAPGEADESYEEGPDEPSGA
jgi:capsular exopolysaccharide synthesis family protein